MYWQRIRSYQLLESDDPKKLDDPQTLTCPNLDSGDKPKDENKPRIRKRVRFNLEVTTYELLPADDDTATSSLEFEGVNNSWEQRPEAEDEQPTTKLTTRFRSHYVVPVLNPIENLSQWKSIKKNVWRNVLTDSDFRVLLSECVLQFCTETRKSKARGSTSHSSNDHKVVARWSASRVEARTWRKISKGIMLEIARES
ncbi:hypothetical protein Cgig2_022142 [Carnegiea gigantea]|uniref:Uncharacterized protein n=1 Tax=Carnegiea gigantea TaxID=171969 RepID=A0A9Q1QAC4_9CARY|nr:hypothetical protein Cgig2_022142 [Carnegiea gigantea]